MEAGGQGGGHPYRVNPLSAAIFSAIQRLEETACRAYHRPDRTDVVDACAFTSLPGDVRADMTAIGAGG
jgi:hypothetical protein